MKDFLTSLSLGSSAALVAVCSTVLAWPLSYLRPVSLRWLAAVAAPFVLAYVLYWSPVWLGSDDVAQYYAWQLLGVGAPFLAGVASSSVVVLVFGRRRAG